MRGWWRNKLICVCWLHSTWCKSCIHRESWTGVSLRRVSVRHAGMVERIKPAENRPHSTWCKSCIHVYRYLSKERPLQLRSEREDRALYLAWPIGLKYPLTLLGESDLLGEGGGGVTLKPCLYPICLCPIHSPLNCGRSPAFTVEGGGGN